MRTDQATCDTHSHFSLGRTAVASYEVISTRRASVVNSHRAATSKNLIGVVFKMGRHFKIFMGLGCTLALAGCTNADDRITRSPEPSSLDQSSVCEVKDWGLNTTTEACTPGQKVVFLPDRWGNEQLPVIFAAVNCDLRYSVVLTEGAVTCIYAPITPDVDEAEESASAEQEG